MFGEYILVMLLLKCEIVLKGVPSGRTRVDSKCIEELWQEKAIGLEVQKNSFVNRAMIENLVDRTAQKQHKTWKFDNTIRHSSHQEAKVHGVGLEIYRVYKLYR